MGVPVEEVLLWDGTPGVRPGVDFYAASWLLVHWLVHARPDAFLVLRQGLARGDDPQAAWRAALPEHDPEDPAALARLDALLDRYARGKLATTTVRGIPLRVVGYGEQPIPPAEVHGLRLALWGFRPDRRELQLRREIDEALEEDPGQPIALEYLGVVDKLDPVPLARRAVQLHPADPRGYTYLARSLTRPEDAPEREDAYRRALQLSPRNPAAYYNLGQELLSAGRAQEALGPLREAAQLAPWSTQILVGLTGALAGSGSCDEAARVARAADDTLPERITPEERRAVRDRLRSLLEPCSGGRGGAQTKGPGRPGTAPSATPQPRG
jgi:tetratricopeptide (TPR) repeat protein